MTWDAENRLASYHQAGVADGEAFDQQLAHTYNGDGQRVERQGFPHDARFVWDGQNIHLKLNLSNVLLDNFQYEFCSDGFGNLISNSTPYFNLYNFLGSTTGLSLAGALAAQFSYGSWGELAVGSPSLPDMPYLFVGRTGYYCDDEGRISTATSPLLPLSVRGRFYRTDWARWVNQDPLRFDAAWLNTMHSRGVPGGIENWYQYVANNPINATDPSGLELSDKEKARLKGCTKCSVGQTSKEIEGAAAAWVECDGKGGLAVFINKKLRDEAAQIVADLQQCGLFKCVEEHEKHHIEQIQFACPDVCKGECMPKPTGGHIQWQSDFCGNNAECFAYYGELQCLNQVASTWQLKGAQLERCKAVLEKRKIFINDIGTKLQCKGRTVGGAFPDLPG